ncbi:MAG: formylglycine-generating enzyme family protein [Candidatus Scalindua sp. AMX11]|nr:MAG: formylglycine-generating enzyme family protein [Candidatus Scalindua sp.]NOG82664.1 formylglycine-generating enzyme family protein [Planctomycetota bacterium]RZV95238.1 MAG: formylglycine-generating enzyme family protein [Candidatus Scalindua sp. SCAELEC01]TDE66282.1 MAG: formylglycine-generating enzyme family protein [Candidatus Scalindua sp. AMX11]GJQ57905.1 MAG: hypothetical protein SCALA701_07060 [Candidatus Scalindua sp.]
MQIIRIGYIRQAALGTIISSILMIMVAVFATLPTAFSEEKGLPIMVQVDILMKAAKKDLENQRWKEAVERFEKVMELDVDLPGEFYFLYGKALFHTQSYESSLSNLINYLTLVGQDGVFYDEAITLIVDSGTKQKEKMHRLEAVGDIEENMVLIQGGCFEMGDIFDRGAVDEKPVHTVCISDFYLGKTEVTQKQWEEIVGDNPSKFTGEDRPVERVSWHDVQDFIKKLNKKTGLHHRLPTEAEWEYAARSGGGDEEWAGTNNKSEIAEYGWFAHNSAKAGTQAVAWKKPNGLGLYDMMGNVWEWCSDWYDSDYYKISPEKDPEGPPEGSNRVIRGGGWKSKPEHLRTVNRNGFLPTSKKFANIGFRLAWSP